MNSWKTEKALANFARFFNARLSFTENGSVSLMWLPGIMYEHLDRSGRLDAWKVSKLMEVVRLISLTDDFLPIAPGCRLIMFGQHHNIYPEFHHNTAQNCPMILKNSVIGLGTSSVTTLSQLIEADEDKTGSVLLERYNRLVSVDMATRKSHPLPPAMFELHQPHVDKVQNSLAMPLLDPPKLSEAVDVQNLTVTALHSDQDFMFHTNQGVYFRFSQDCASKASEAGKFKQFDKDMCFYPIKMSAALHKGESWPGDELIVHSWEDPTLKMTLNFVITKNDQEVFYSRFEYYNEDMKEN